MFKGTFTGFYDVNSRQIKSGDEVEVNDYSKALGLGNGIIDLRKDADGYQEWVIVQRHRKNPNGLHIRGLREAIKNVRVV